MPRGSSVWSLKSLAALKVFPFLGFSRAFSKESKKMSLVPDCSQWCCFNTIMLDMPRRISVRSFTKLPTLIYATWYFYLIFAAASLYYMIHDIKYIKLNAWYFIIDQFYLMPDALYLNPYIWYKIKAWYLLTNWARSATLEIDQIIILFRLV